MTNTQRNRSQALALLSSLASSRSHLLTLLTAFQQYLIDSSSQVFYNDEYPLPHEPLLAVLQTLAHGAVQWEDLAIFTWCSSHPFLCVGRNQHAPWHAVFGSMCRSLKDLVVSEETIQGILAIYHSDSLALTSSSGILATATSRMLENLASIPAVLSPLYAALHDELSSNASSTVINSVSSHDLSIWRTPENVEWKPHQEDSGYIPEITTSQTRKTRAKKGSNPFGKNDDNWAAELKAEINKDKIAKEEAEKAIEARKKTLEEQAIIRARVDTTAIPYRRVLLTIQALVRGGGKNFEQYLMECVMWVNGMLTNPVVCVMAREVFGECASVIANPSLRAALQNSLHYVFFQQFCTYFQSLS